MIKGVDISAHQVPSKIDYDKLSKEIDFAILRVGYTGYGINPPHTNNFNKDVHFETHYKELAKRGVDIGIYYYGGAINDDEVNRELKIVKDAIEGKKLTYPIYYDVEESRNHGRISKKELTDVVHMFCSKLELEGHYVGVYASLDWIRNKIGDISRFDLWLAQWGVNQPSMACGLWQYTSDGKLNGYSGRLDVNIAYKDYPKIITEMSKPTHPTNPLDVFTDEQLAEKVWANEFGTGNARKKALGDRYEAVQAIVNKQAKEKQTLTAGAIVRLVKEPLYQTSTAKNAVNTISGTYYYWDDKVVNGRRRITNQKNRVGKLNQITGWIKAR